MNERVNPNVPELPKSSTALAAMRKLRSKPTLNDHIEIIHVKLFDDLEYQRLWDAVYDSDAVEGSLVADNFACALMVREYAKANGDTYIAGKNLTTIAKSLGVVTRRYGQSRTERRATMQGEVEQPSPPDEI